MLTLILKLYIAASKLLINLYAKRKRKSGLLTGGNEAVIALVGNKNDLEHERMVDVEDARNFARVSIDKWQIVY